MSQRQIQWCHSQKRRNAQRDLPGHDGRQDDHEGFQRNPRLEPDPDSIGVDRQRHQIAHPAVMHLHGRPAFENGRKETVPVQIAFRDKVAIHQRPGVVDPACVQTGNECPEQDLHENHGQKGEAHPRQRSAAQRRRAETGFQRQPDRITQNDEGHAQMGCQTVLADIQPVDQATGHHPPADRALQPSQAQ